MGLVSELGFWIWATDLAFRVHDSIQSFRVVATVAFRVQGLGFRASVGFRVRVNAPVLLTLGLRIGVLYAGFRMQGLVTKVGLGFGFLKRFRCSISGFKLGC